MAIRLPPLNALRAFEAAGRNQSFTLAAEELFVTSGAISRQIRTLEDHLGFQLFRRSHREVTLTPDAAIYLESISDVFARMERATGRLVDSRRQRVLHIHNSITCTLRWLVPRLPSFHVRYPKTEIRISTSLPSASDLAASANDVSIQTRTEEVIRDMTALHHHRLVDVELVPVCNPDYARGHRLDHGPARLADTVLLHSVMRPNDWRTWLGMAGVASADPETGIKFESSSHALQAAIEGVGVAIAIRAFVERDLEHGRLITPFDRSFRDGSAFYLSYSRAAAKLTHIAEFRDWLIAAA